MTNEELKVALLTHRPVYVEVVNSTTLRWMYVSAIIYTDAGRGNVEITVEATKLGNKNHVVRVSPHQVHFEGVKRDDENQEDLPAAQQSLYDMRY